MLTRYHHSVSCRIIATAVRLKCFDAALFEYQYHFFFPATKFLFISFSSSSSLRLLLFGCITTIRVLVVKIASVFVDVLASDSSGKDCST